nr:hypothetical protein BdHM001_35600 [Bdellovibrio sp. HM001]
MKELQKEFGVRATLLRKAVERFGEEEVRTKLMSAKEVYSKEGILENGLKKYLDTVLKNMMLTYEPKTRDELFVMVYERMKNIEFDHEMVQAVEKKVSEYLADEHLSPEDRRFENVNHFVSSCVAWILGRYRYTQAKAADTVHEIGKWAALTGGQCHDSQRSDHFVFAPGFSDSDVQDLKETVISELPDDQSRSTLLLLIDGVLQMSAVQSNQDFVTYLRFAARRIPAIRSFFFGECFQADTIKAPKAKEQDKKEFAPLFQYRAIDGKFGGSVKFVHNEEEVVLTSMIVGTLDEVKADLVALMNCHRNGKSSELSRLKLAA